MQAESRKLHPFAHDAAMPFDLEASLIPEPEGIRLIYALRGPISRLRFPPPSTPQAADELWKQTCFELFIQAEGAERYEEWNLSPSSAWAHYTFQDYRKRDGGGALRPLEPLVFQNDGRMASLRTALPWPAQAPRAGSRFRFALTAVLEHADRSLSYWALRHAGERPDFHLAASWIGSCRQPLPGEEGIDAG